METKMKLISFSILESDIEKLKHDAHHHDMNVSKYIRWLIEKERKQK